MNALEDGLRIRYIAKGQVLTNRSSVERSWKVREREEGAQLGCENKTLGRAPVIERLDAKAIAGEQQSFSTRVPDGERKHPAQLVHETLTLLFIEVHERLGVTSAR